LTAGAADSAKAAAARAFKKSNNARLSAVAYYFTCGTIMGVGQIEGVEGKSFFVSIIGEFNDKAPYI